MNGVKESIKKVIKVLSNDDFYNRYEDYINKYQLISLELFSVFGIIITFFNVLLQLTFGKLPSFYQSLILFLYCLLMFFVYNGYSKTHVKDVRKITSLFAMPILIFSIIMGTILDQNNPAFSFSIAIIGIPLFIFDKPKKILKYISSLLILFLVCSYFSKSRNLFLIDFIHFVIFGTFSIIGTLYVLYLRTISLKNEIKANYRAEHDDLTNCYNRRGGNNLIKRNKLSSEKSAFAIIDVDDFKEFNDLYGHLVGDNILINIADILKRHCHNEESVIRIGGDEFAIYFPDINNEQTLENKFIAIKDDLSNLKIENCNKVITVSIGAVIYRKDFNAFKDVFQEADHLLYSIKENSKDNFIVKTL